MNIITVSVALKIWDILVEHVEVYNSKRERESFVYHQTKAKANNEYRIQGKLGFGGKFWNNAGRWYVNCYPEDSTPERKKIIEVVNAKLKVLFDAEVDNPPGT